MFVPQAPTNPVPVAPPGDSSTGLDTPQLPRTGGELGSLSLMGMLLALTGGMVMLLTRAPRPVGRHERPR